MMQRPEFAADFFWRHNVVRFLAPFDHAKPVWFYLPGLLLGLLPWWLVLPGLGRTLLARSGEVARQRPAGLGLALLAFLWTLVFFSAAGCKRPTYLLPALPPLALAIGWYLHATSPRDLWRVASQSAGASLALVLGAGLLVTALAGGLHFLPVREALLLMAVCVAALALLALAWSRVTWAHATLGGFVVMLVGVHVHLPAYNDLFSLRGKLRKVAGIAEREGRPIVCYPQRYESLSFYLPNGRVQVFGAHQKAELLTYLRANPGTLLLVKSGPVLERLLAALPEGIEYHTADRRAAIQVGRVQARGVPLETMVALEDD
jgi:4-amino-4-deoxy-L-arabinose transferase-like glycosyltransferase